MYCQVLLIGLNLSDISGLMKLSCFEDIAIKDSDFIYIKYARVYTWEYKRVGGGTSSQKPAIVMQSHGMPQ